MEIISIQSNEENPKNKRIWEAPKCQSIDLRDTESQGNMGRPDDQMGS